MRPVAKRPSAPGLRHWRSCPWSTAAPPPDTGWRMVL